MAAVVAQDDGGSPTQTDAHVPLHGRTPFFLFFSQRQMLVSSRMSQARHGSSTAHFIGLLSGRFDGRRQ